MPLHKTDEMAELDRHKGATAHMDKMIPTGNQATRRGVTTVTGADSPAGRATHQSDRQEQRAHRPDQGRGAEEGGQRQGKEGRQETL